LPCTPPFVCLQLLIPPALWSTIKTITAIQIQDIDPFYNSIQLDRRPSPTVTPLHSILCLALLRSLLFNIKFTIQSPADTTNATTVSPSLQAVRESQITLSTFHGIQNLQCRPVCNYDSSRAHHPYASPMPPSYPASSEAPSLPPTVFGLSDSTNVPATNGRRQPTPTSTGPLSPDRSKDEKKLRLQNISNGWLPACRIRHRINPDFPDSCPSC
jgi:hypothetical protein